MGSAAPLAAAQAYNLAFQISPIILVGGIASGSLGNMLPIIALTGQAASFLQGVVSSGNLSATDFFASFQPVAGGTLINNTVGTYPFANQSVAANAIIQQPLNISLRMLCPVNQEGGYLTKLPILTSLQQSFQNHNASGGLYNIATPGFVYTNCIMTGMQDVTPGNTAQQQVEFQIDFTQPLVTTQQTSSAFSSLMGKLQAGQPVTSSSWSGIGPSTGTPAPGAAQGNSGLTGSAINFLSSPL